MGFKLKKAQVHERTVSVGFDVRNERRIQLEKCLREGLVSVGGREGGGLLPSQKKVDV